MIKITVLFSLFISCNLYAQDTVLNYFTATLTQQNEVYLNWEIKGGNTCNGITIYHSTDNIQYTFIGDIPGICGSTTTNERYSFTHANPLGNAINYYKIELGANGHTAITYIQVYALNEQGYTLFPNPSDGTFNFYFKNNFNENIQLAIYDSKGKEVYKEITTNNYLIINLNNLPKGVYLYYITSNSMNIINKLILN